MDSVRIIDSAMSSWRSGRSWVTHRYRSRSKLVFKSGFRRCIEPFMLVSPVGRNVRVFRMPTDLKHSKRTLTICAVSLPRSLVKFQGRKSSMPKRNLANAPDYSQSLFNFELELAVKAAPVRKRRKKPSVKVVSIKTDCGFVPSAFQSAIFDAVRSGTKSVVISSVPGSGKTTTVKELVPSSLRMPLFSCLHLIDMREIRYRRKSMSLKRERGRKALQLQPHSVGQSIA